MPLTSDRDRSEEMEQGQKFTDRARKNLFNKIISILITVLLIASVIFAVYYYLD